MKRATLCLLCVLLLACGAKAPLAAQAPPEPTAEAIRSTPVPTPVPTPMPTPASETVSTPTQKPSSAPTPEPTEEPTPVPTPEPEVIDEERLSSGEFDSYFDDAVFIGDSITRTLNNYVIGRRAEQEGFFGTAKFFGVTSMSAIRAARNKVGDSINFMYRGRKLTLTEVIKETGAKKVFVLLGVNELVWCTWDAELAAFQKIIDLIRSVEPDAEIVIQAVLPVTAAYCRRERLKIDEWNSFNDVLRALCEENGVAFLSFAEQVMDRDGYLDRNLSNDGEYHLNEKGNDIWIAALRKYAASRMLPDAIFATP